MISAFQRLFVVMIGALLAIIVRGQNTPMEKVHSTPEMPDYVLVVNDGADITTYHVPDSVFNQIAGHTIFKVNRTQLNLNDAFLHALIDTVLPFANAEEWMLVGIDLRGAASPEGPYQNNVRLSHGRAKALIDLMSSRLDSVYIDEAKISTIAEDYPRLLWMMEQAGDDDAPVVREIINKYTINDMASIKRELQRYDHGRLWRRMLKEYFPALRSARVVLFFRRVHPRLQAEKAPSPEVPLLKLNAPYHGPMAMTLVRTLLPKPVKERRHALAVSSNLLYDIFYMPQYGWAPMPNVQLEYFPLHGHYTVLAGFLTPYYHRWDRQQFFQIRDYHLEVRRYFNPGTRHLGPYVGVYANANIYGIGLSAKKGWEGEGFGGALKAGYVLPLGGGRWRLDMHVAVGGYTTRYDPYVYGNPITGDIDGDYYYDYTGHKDDFIKRNHRFSWMGPTEIGITLTYDLLFHKLPSLTIKN